MGPPQTKQTFGIEREEAVVDPVVKEVFPRSLPRTLGPACRSSSLAPICFPLPEALEPLPLAMRLDGMAASLSAMKLMNAREALGQ